MGRPFEEFGVIRELGVERENLAAVGNYVYFCKLKNNRNRLCAQ